MNKELLLRRIAKIACIFFVGLVLINSLSVVADKFIIDYGEGVILNFSNIISDGGTYFVDINNPPFIQGAYPPAMPLLLSLARAVTPFIPPLNIGRFISLLFGACIFVVIFRIIRLENPASILTTEIAALFIVSPYFISWAPLLRVDMMAVFLSLFGIYIFRKFTTTLIRFASIPIFILAFYTKQSAVIAPIAIMVYLLIKNRKELLFFSLLYGGLLATTFYAANVVTDGNLFLHLITYMGFTPLNFSLVPAIYLIFISSNAIILFLIVKFSRKEFKNEGGLYLIYTLLSFISIITIGKPGANLNYLIEPTMALIVFLGVVVDYKKMYALKTMPLLLMIQMILYLAVGNILITKFSRIDNLGAEIANTYISKLGDDPILSEEPGHLSVNNKLVIYEPFQLGLMGKFGLWDKDKITKLCENKYFSLAIVGWRIKSTPELSACLDQHYRIEIKSADVDFMVPK